MRIVRNEIVDLEEYQIIINYDGKGGLDITVLDDVKKLKVSISQTAPIVMVQLKMIMKLK